MYGDGGREHDTNPGPQANIIVQVGLLLFSA